MFATRNQENLIHGHQTTAAAKPLNRGVRGIAPKTPGPNGGKVTFGNAVTTRKPGHRDDENSHLVEVKKGGNADRFALVTPLAPKDRAPLGAKATNANGQAFKTPAPGLQKTQKRTTSARKTKLKIHQPDAVTSEQGLKSFGEEDDIPDIEYCPPKVIPLPDLPEDPYIFTDDYASPLLDHRMLLASTFSIHQDNSVDPGNRTHCRRDLDDADAMYEVRRDEECRIQAEKEILGDMDTLTVKKKEALPLRSLISPAEAIGPSSLEAKQAASALSSKPHHQLPHFAATTAATRAKSAKTAALPETTVSPRGSIVSRTTIGYSRGRKVSATLRPAAVQTRQSGNGGKDGGPTGKRRSENEILQELLCSGDHGTSEDGSNADESLFLESSGGFQLPGEEHDEAFQLDPAIFQL